MYQSKELSGRDNDVIFMGLHDHPVNGNHYDGKDNESTLDSIERFMMVCDGSA